MKKFTVHMNQPPPATFVYDPDQPTLETERLAFFLNWNLRYACQLSMDVRQDEDSDYQALQDSVATWTPLFLTWVDDVKTALEAGSDIPKMTAVLTAIVKAGLKGGSIYAIIINVIIALIANSSKNSAETGQETGQGKLAELFEEAFLDIENEDSVLKKGLLSSTTEVFAWLDALQSAGLSITITPQGVSVSYGDPE